VMCDMRKETRTSNLKEKKKQWNVSLNEIFCVYICRNIRIIYDMWRTLLIFIGHIHVDFAPSNSP
jgi:hypothetical protein